MFFSHFCLAFMQPNCTALYVESNFGVSADVSPFILVVMHFALSALRYMRRAILVFLQMSLLLFWL
jgi:hypothetical protein